MHMKDLWVAAVPSYVRTKEKSIINILRISRREPALLRQAGGENRIDAVEPTRVLMEGPAGGHPTAGFITGGCLRWGGRNMSSYLLLSCAGMLATGVGLPAHILPSPRKCPTFIPPRREKLFRSRGKPSQPVCVPSLLADSQRCEANAKPRWRLRSSKDGS